MESNRVAALGATLFLAAGFTSSAFGQNYFDVIDFGDGASETAHAFAGPSTQVITGGLGQSARRCMANPSSIYGGDMTFDMSVDPVKRNYFTVKLWGEDDTDENMGRLYLYVPLNGTNFQVGYRHEGDYICLSVAANKPPLPDRFFYSTTLLPLWMTQGKTNLTLKIVSAGRIYALGSGVAPSGNYQFLMMSNSRGIYRGYIHTEAVLLPEGETQGTTPATITRPFPGESVLSPGGTFYDGINNFINGKLSATVNTANFNTTDAEMLARAYWMSNLSAYQSSALITRVIAVVDAFATDYFSDNGSVSSDGGNESWGGRFGPLGYAIHLLRDVPEFANSLDDLANYGSGGVQVRSNAWSVILLASRDYGRFNRDGKHLSNQGIKSDQHIYWANLGLIALGSPDAFSVSDGERYLREAIGIDPWCGSDLPGGGSSFKFGTNYYQVTPKGLTREWGYVGNSYGEMQYHAADFYRYTTNTIFRDQAIKMIKARAPFRRPAIEIAGNPRYRSMESIGLLAWRGANESDGDYADGLAYGDRAQWALGMSVAGATLDTNALGYAKQMLADGQYFAQLVDDNRYYSGLTHDSRDSLYAFEDYLTVKSALAEAATNGTVLPQLPMTEGEPDFVWADEVGGIVAIKHSGERLWIAPYWQAKTGTGVNGVGRFHYSTTNYDQYGVLETTPSFDYSGAYFTRPNLMDKPEENRYTPPDNPTQAYLGERLPVAAAPVGASDGMPFRGKCDFYAFRYGHYLIGMNATDNRTFELKTPSDFASATDLVTGQTLSGPVYVGPNSTVVLYLDSAVDSCPVPNAPLLLTAASGNDIQLDWSAASGATSYKVKRSTSKGGPYAMIASNVVSTAFTDTTAAGGVTHYYIVSGVNACGESYDSMEVAASAGLPSPWNDTDIGSVGVAGSASYENGTFVVMGSGADIGGSSDKLHFAYRSMTGNGTLTARLVSMQSGGSADKVGLMMRESTGSNSRLAAFLLDLFQTDKVRLPIRTSTGGGMNWTGADGPNISSLPLWLRLTRSGNTFTGYISSDGSNWTQAVSRSVTLNSTLQAGLAVCSRNDAALNVSTFDAVTLPGWPLPPSTPTGLGATPGDAQVALNWSAAVDAAGYNVKRATVAGGPYAILATNVTGLAFTDNSPSNGTLYHFVVSASNVAGESDHSDEVSARPVCLAPPQIASRANANQIELSWPAGHTGWRLEAQTHETNLGITTNWFTVSGSDQTNLLRLPTDQPSGSMFFRLALP